jgi:hypothetical protein
MFLSKSIVAEMIRRELSQNAPDMVMGYKPTRDGHRVRWTQVSTAEIVENSDKVALLERKLEAMERFFKIDFIDQSTRPTKARYEDHIDE